MLQQLKDNESRPWEIFASVGRLGGLVAGFARILFLQDIPVLLELFGGCFLGNLGHEITHGGFVVLILINALANDVVGFFLGCYPE